MLNLNLKKGIDLPVYQWLRFLPAGNTSATSCVTTADTLNNRYMYYMAGTNSFWRYDTWTDGWQQLANPPYPILTAVSMRFQSYNGYWGRVIASPAANQFRGPGLYGGAMDGYKVRIVEGKGIGQERTIIDVADPVIADQGILTAANNAFITDSTKTWIINQWVGFQVRFTLGTGQSMVRKILYNTANTIYWADPNFMAVDTFANPYTPVTPVITAGLQAVYVIESSVVTVDSPWTITPDNTSEFMVLSGGIWCVTSVASSPFAYFMYYDVLSDVWYYKSFAANLFPAALGTDFALERPGEYGGQFLAGTVSSSTATTLTSIVVDMVVNRWANYQVRILSGVGIGQIRPIKQNDAGTFTLMRSWDINPTNGATFGIYGDNDKIYLAGNGASAMYQYTVEGDMWAAGRIYERGTCRQLAAMRNGDRGIGLTSITRVGTVGTATAAINHNFRTGDSLTLSGATGADAALYNGTFTVTVTGITTFTYTMVGTPTATATFNTLSTTLVVDSVKNWTVNEHANKLVYIMSVGPTGTIAWVRKILSNTSNTLSFTLALSGVPTNGTYRYVIADLPSLGEEDSGTTTAGATTTLTDSAKAWVVNIWAGRRLRFTAGTGLTQELTITSNTANTLTFALATAPDVSTTYSILSIAPRSIGTALVWAPLTTMTNAQGRYMFSWRGGGTLSLDRYDLTTHKWQLISYFPQTETFTAGTQFTYDGVDRIYIQKDATHRVYYYDIPTNTVALAGHMPYIGGTAVIGNRMEVVQTPDGAKYLYFMRHTGAEFFRMLIGWF